MKYEVIKSTLPLEDKYELDGSLITDDTAFISDIAQLYSDDPTVFAQSVPLANYTIKGSLTNNSNVLSGFGSSNYIDTKATFNPNGQTWEYFIKFKTGSSVSTAQGVAGCLGSGDYCTPFYIESGSLKCYLSSNGSNWDIASASTVMSVSTNTTYTMKVEFTGTAYKWYKLVNDAWSEVYSLASSASVKDGGNIIFGNNRGQSSGFGGSIDMNETYIKINGDVWWSGTVQATPEQAWQAEVTETGVCGKFVYDSVNNTVRLPKYGNTFYMPNQANVYYYLK